MATSHPFLTPRADGGQPLPAEFSYLGYNPSYPINAAGAAVFGVIAIALTYRQLKFNARYMLAMTIGVCFYLVGIVARFPLRNSPNSLGLFLIQNLAIILSPCAFIATVYAILGQMALRQVADDCLPIRPTKIAKYFIWSDVATFFLQSSGGGMEVSASLTHIGSKIFLIGLILQLVSFLIFCSFFAVYVIRLRARHPHTFADRSWHPLGWALVISCIGIVIRSIFRTVENSQGFQGYLSVHEGYFWLLDALPLAVATAVFYPCWPELYLYKSSGKHSALPLSSMDSK